MASQNQVRTSSIVTAFSESFRNDFQTYVYPHLQHIQGVRNQIRLNGVLDDVAFSADLEGEYNRLVLMLKSASFLTVFVSGEPGFELKAIAAACKNSVACGLVVGPIDQKQWHALAQTQQYRAYAFILSSIPKETAGEINDLHAYLPKIEPIRSISSDGKRIADRIALAVSEEGERAFKRSGQYLGPIPGPYGLQ